MKHIQLIYREGGETVSTLAGMEMAGVGWGGVGLEGHKGVFLDAPR